MSLFLYFPSKEERNPRIIYAKSGACHELAQTRIEMREGFKVADAAGMAEYGISYCL
jgi:hypothetical protein